MTGARGPGGRVHDPGGRFLRKGARTAVAMSACFLVGLHVVGNDQFAVVATFTAAALLGIADFGGNRTERLRATAATLAAGAALLALGTAVSTDTALATVTMFAVTLVVAFTAVFSGSFAAASSAVIVFYVVATGIEAPASTIPAREAGLAVGGAVSLVVAGWLWPDRGVDAAAAALADVYAALAARVRAHATGPGGAAGGPGDDTPGHGAPVPFLRAEEAVARSAWRPDGPARPHKARLYLLQGAERLAVVVGALPPGAPDPALAAVTGDLLGVLGGQLAACGRAVATGGSVLPDPEAVEAAKARFGADAERCFAVRASGGADPGELGRLAGHVFTLHELSWGVVLAAVHCRVLFGAPAGASERAAGTALVRAVGAGAPTAATWVRRARRNLSPHSVHLRNSLRLAVGLALARLAVGVLGLEHGFWVGFATLVVVKTSAAGTRATAWQAAVGTAIGFVLSTALVATLGVHALAYSLVLPVAVFAAFYLPGAVSFVLGQACFTVVIVVLFNLLKPAGWTVGLVRLVDVVVGAAIGLAIGLAIWPRGASGELGRAVGRLVRAGGEYATATVAGVVGRPVGGAGAGDADGLRRACVAAAIDAEDVFSQYLAEPHQPDAPVTAWSTVVAAAHRVWFGATTVAVVPVRPPASPAQADLADRVVADAAVVARNHRGLAAALEGEGPLLVEPLAGTGGAGDPADPTASMRLLEVDAWLGGLNRDVFGLVPSLRAIGRVARRARGERQPADGRA